jgi:hypothetical protein
MGLLSGNRQRAAPTAVEVKRAEPLRDRRSTPQLSARLPVVESLQTAPPPVDYTSAWNIGKDPAHAWANIWRYQSLAIDDKLAIMGWPFAAIGKFPSALVVGMPQGTQNPIRERSNIQSPAQTSYGALSAVQAPIITSPLYAKLT